VSAWIVGRAHIDVLVQALCEGEYVTDDPDSVGRVLWRENLRSVAARYPGDGDGERPGPIDFRDSDVDTYTYRRPRNRPSLEALLVAIGCYGYQSCEHRGWESSTAQMWMATLRQAVLDAGTKEPGAGSHMEAWGYSEADVHGAAA
jgi:hypothetical protein